MDYAQARLERVLKQCHAPVHNRGVIHCAAVESVFKRLLPRPGRDGSTCHTTGVPTWREHTPLLVPYSAPEFTPTPTLHALNLSLAVHPRGPAKLTDRREMKRNGVPNIL